MMRTNPGVVAVEGDVWMRVSQNAWIQKHPPCSASSRKILFHRRPRPHPPWQCSLQLRRPALPPRHRHCSRPTSRRRLRAARAGSTASSKGLGKTGSSISTVFTGTRIDDELYESSRPRCWSPIPAPWGTQFLLDDLKRRVKAARRPIRPRSKALLAQAITELLQPLEKPLVIGSQTPDRHDGRGRQRCRQTTTIGKAGQAPGQRGRQRAAAAADTFRRRARAAHVWADRNLVEIVSQEGRPGRSRFDAVQAGRARARRGDRRHRRPPADPAAPDGGAQEDQARGAEGRRQRPHECCW